MKSTVIGIGDLTLKIFEMPEKDVISFLMQVMNRAFNKGFRFSYQWKDEKGNLMAELRCNKQKAKEA
jgi:hypothetical protein